MVQRKAAEPVDTRGDILRSATILFRTQGYDAVSVQAIIDAARVSKGTFYYYFKTKEELLDSLVERVTHEALDEIRAAVETEPASAIARLNRFLAASKACRLRNLALVKPALQALMRDENAIIREKSCKRTTALVSPMLADIIRQGVAEGVFVVPDADDMAELILQIWGFLGEKNARTLRDSPDIDSSTTIIERRIAFAVEAVERLLCLPKGAVERFDHAYLSRIMSALRESPSS
ncbi:MAG: TetR/AcrR family transcriptional regulator [Vicinamibacteria bacterium]|nr:TetR/AcrR family transcriptional regulator [Vicinamibacteria bacterium]